MPQLKAVHSPVFQSLRALLTMPQKSEDHLPTACAVEPCFPEITASLSRGLSRGSEG